MGVLLKYLALKLMNAPLSVHKTQFNSMNTSFSHLEEVEEHGLHFLSHLISQEGLNECHQRLF